ncbi:MAG: hypothetical protein QXQ87_07450 [Halobacteria archaeon]
MAVLPLPMPVVREGWDRPRPTLSDGPPRGAPRRGRASGGVEAGGSAPHPHLSGAGATGGVPLRRRVGEGGLLRGLPLLGG